MNNANVVKPKYGNKIFNEISNLVISVPRPKSLHKTRTGVPHVKLVDIGALIRRRAPTLNCSIYRLLHSS